MISIIAWTKDSTSKQRRYNVKQFMDDVHLEQFIERLEKLKTTDGEYVNCKYFVHYIRKDRVVNDQILHDLCNFVNQFYNIQLFEH